MSNPQDILYRCICLKCGYETPSLIDWNTPNVPCVKCGGEYHAEKATVSWQFSAEVIQPQYACKIIGGPND